MNKDKLNTLSSLIIEKYDAGRHLGAIDCVMPGYFGGNDVLFIAQNPGLLKEGVAGDMAYLRAYDEKEYNKLGEYYIDALRSSRGTYGTFISDIYGQDWSAISFTNVYKCPFIDNNLPSELLIRIPITEMKILTRQIQYLQPKVIVAVGSVAQKACQQLPSEFKNTLMLTYHPAYLKRTGRYETSVERYKKQLAQLCDASTKSV